MGGDFLVHGLRPLEGQRALVLAGLVLRRAIGRLALEHRARWGQAIRRLRIHGARDVGETWNWRVLAWRHEALFGRRFVNVRETDALHRIQVIEVAPELVKAVRRRQRVGVVAEVILAELAAVVAEIAQEPRERRRAGLQVGGASRKLGRNHASAQGMHAGEKGIAPGGSALLSVVVHESRAFAGNPVDVWRFPDHQALMIATRLHPADVIAHDEQDIGFLVLRLGRSDRAEKRSRGYKQRQAVMN